MEDISATLGVGSLLSGPITNGQRAPEKNTRLLTRGFYRVQSNTGCVARVYIAHGDGKLILGTRAFGELHKGVQTGCSGASYIEVSLS